MKYSGLLVLLLSACMAQAGEVKENGAFMGVSVGDTEWDDDGAFDGLGAKFDDEDSGFQVWGGYKFFSWFAVEGKYADLGEFTLSGGGVTLTAEASVLSASAVFILPFGQSGWDIYGQVGLGSIYYDVKSNCCGSDDDTEGVVTAGLGVRWTPVPEMTLSLGADSYAWEEEIGFRDYDTVMTISKLGVQYNF